MPSTSNDVANVIAHVADFADEVADAMSEAVDFADHLADVANDAADAKHLTTLAMHNSIPCITRYLTARRPRG